MEGDGLPSQVCVDCFHRITRAFSFKQLCNQSDRALREFLSKSNLKIEQNNYESDDQKSSDENLEDPLQVIRDNVPERGGEQDHDDFKGK